MSFQVKNLYGGYGKTDVCKNISFKIENAEILCVLGPNGSGKSTLFKLILGFLKHKKGDILFDDKSLSELSPKELAKEIAYIPQQHSPEFSFTALEIVLMGRTSYIKNFSMPSDDDINEAKLALKKLDILDLAHKDYTLLSGGQRQMVLIARAICQKAKILIMDEPCANLDYANEQKVMSIIRNLANEGYIVILSTHSPEQPFSCASKVLLMKEGEVFSFGNPEDVLTSKNLHEVYGIKMEILHACDSQGKKRSICVPMNLEV